MLTTEGKLHIKRYLAGYVPVIAQSMSFGIGSRTESASDIALHLETSRSAINLTSYDFASNRLVYKASIPEEYVGKIYEVGVYSLEQDPSAGEFSSRILTSFDSATEDWLTTGNPSTYSTANARVGVDSLLHTHTGAGAVTSSLDNIALDLGGYSAADSFTFAFNTSNTAITSLRLRFVVDGSNYYDFNVGAQTAGYKIVEMNKSTATVTGAPNWTNITSIQVTSVSNGASAVDFEAIRVEDKDAASLDYILVARKVLATPVTKVPGMSQDFEYSLAVTL